MAGISARYRDLLVCLLLAGAILLVYGQVRDFTFIDYDDLSYVTENPHLRAGFTRNTLLWALTDYSTGYWHPLTWFTHLLDWQLFGNNAGGHHWTNVLFHLANALLLYLVLKHMTGAWVKSACVAALFALHPLNVESVAWVAERKNVLSTFFWIATMGAYSHYVQRPGFFRYAGVFLLFALGLTAKPMLVTLPFVLLLLDYWPLKRWHLQPAGRQPQITNHKSQALWLGLEKMPLLLLTAAACALTLLAGRSEGAVTPLTILSLKSRLMNAALAYAAYLEKTFWPHDLAVFYPYGRVVTLRQIVGALAILLAITLFASLKRCNWPALFTGWFWYLGTLVPVIGLVQAGAQAMADRYTYVPGLGLYMALVWSLPAALRRFSYGKVLLAGIAVLTLPVAAFLSWQQAAYWRDSITLFTHALQVTKANALAHNNLGVALANRGRLKEAADQYRQALRIKPDYAEAMNNLGVALLGEGKLAEAADSYRQALQLHPDQADYYNNLGIALARQNRWAEAFSSYERALTLRPGASDFHNNLACALAEAGKVREALPHFLEALRLKPDDAQLHYNTGVAFLTLADIRQARQYFRQALLLKPGFPAAAWQLAKMDEK